MRQFMCPLCSRRVPVSTTIKGKPYIACEDCGVQIFVRYKQGIERLEKLLRADASMLPGFVVCGRCDVAVRRKLHNIDVSFSGEAGLFCPSCDRLLLEAPRVGNNGLRNKTESEPTGRW